MYALHHYALLAKINVCRFDVAASTPNAKLPNLNVPAILHCQCNPNGVWGLPNGIEMETGNWKLKTEVEMQPHSCCSHSNVGFCSWAPSFPPASSF